MITTERRKRQIKGDKAKEVFGLLLYSDLGLKQRGAEWLKTNLKEFIVCYLFSPFFCGEQLFLAI